MKRRNIKLQLKKPDVFFVNYTINWLTSWLLSLMEKKEMLWSYMYLNISVKRIKNATYWVHKPNLRNPIDDHLHVLCNVYVLLNLILLLSSDTKFANSWHLLFKTCHSRPELDLLNLKMWTRLFQTYPWFIAYGRLETNLPMYKPSTKNKYTFSRFSSEAN